MSEESIRTALVEHWREIYPPDETMLAPRFIVVAEVIDSDGDDTLRLMHTEALSPWMRSGMLRAATLIADEAINEGWCGDGDDD